MDLVVGASESTVKSLLTKLGGLLAQEYTLIRGVGGDLQYITDELRTMQSFLRDLGDTEQDHRMKDWMKQIRDMTYDVEDCVDDSGHRMHTPRWLRSDMTCYFLVNSVYEVLTWGPRRDIAAKISDLKMRAQQISERRQRYGVENPTKSDQVKVGTSTGFNAAENQDASLQLVAVKEPLGVNQYMNELMDWMNYDEANNPNSSPETGTRAEPDTAGVGANLDSTDQLTAADSGEKKKGKNGVLALVGFGGVGKTIIATDLYRKFGDRFECRAMVTVSQGSDLEAILTSIKNQVMPQSDEQQQQEKKGLAAAVRRGAMAAMAKCSVGATSDNKPDSDDQKLDGGLQSDSDDKKQPAKKGLAAAIKAKCCFGATLDKDSKPDSDDQKQNGSLPSDSDDEEQPAKKGLARAVHHMLDQVSGCTSSVMPKCSLSGASTETQDNAKLRQLKDDLNKFLTKKSYLLLVDDVWSTSTWEDIRKSLPKSKVGSRIIVTTRFQAVATTCKRGEGDKIHTVEVLGPKESESLFKQAVSESNAFKHEVLDSLWNLCGGLPLALVTMAGHVACNIAKQPKDLLDNWKSLLPESGKDGREDLNQEEGFSKKTNQEEGSNKKKVQEEGPFKSTSQEEGVPKKRNQEEVGRIISHCYSDMPAEIKTCSLYLSIFPKGNRISRKRLTRRWIAEGFVSEKQGMSMEDVAETYFTHLIRRKIIRPVEHSSNGRVKKCVVHDMILEHIVAKAGEENFITVVGGHWLMPLPSSKVRRLSLQGSDSKHAKDIESMNLSHVRSLTMFGSLNQLPLHCFKFRIVQVLDLEGCTGFRQRHANEICNMVFLKYLSLRRTDIKMLPKEIKKLEKLETLDIRETNVRELPKAVCNLGCLVNILGGNKRTRKALRLPEQLVKKKKMAALRILSGIEVVGPSADLHHLTELRKLAIYRLRIKKSDPAFKELLSSIEYLGGFSLHTLIICEESSRFLQSLKDLVTPPKFFIALELSGKMVMFPEWIKELDVLSKLTLSVTLLSEDNLKHLSKLKALFSLSFTSGAAKESHKIVTVIEKNRSVPNGEIIVPADGFEKLKLLRFTAPRMPLLRFSLGAMPSLERLELRFSMLEGLLDMEYLLKLKEVHLSLQMKKKKEETQRENDIVIEHINKMIEDDIAECFPKKDGVQGAASTVKKPKIIFHQYYD